MVRLFSDGQGTYLPYTTVIEIIVLFAIREPIALQF